MTKRLNDDDMTEIAGGGVHVFPKPGSPAVNPRTRGGIDSGLPGGPGPEPEAEGTTSGGTGDLFKG